MCPKFSLFKILILKSENDITKIRKESLLIESLDSKKGLCLLSNKGINQRSMREVSIKDQTEYAVEDADITFQLKSHFEKEMKRTK